MNIDISIVNFTGVAAQSYNVRYARIDNTTTPVYTSGGSPTPAQFPFSISGVPNGQYRVGITPVYADQRVCAETTQDTDACPNIISLNAVQVGSNLQITYTAPGSVPQVYLTVNYPNGGSVNGTYTNGQNNSTILIPVPPGVNGNYNVYLQSVCDPDTGFYSQKIGPVTVAVSSDVVIPHQIARVGACTGINSSYQITGGTVGDILVIEGAASGLIQMISGAFTRADLAISSPNGTSASDSSDCYSDGSSHGFSVSAQSIVTMVGSTAVINFAVTLHNSSTSVSSSSVKIVSVNGVTVNRSVTGCVGNSSTGGTC